MGSTTQVTDEKGSIENSQSLNQYSYVQGNPVNLSDPFGLCPEGGGTEDVRNLLGHTVLDILGFVPLIGFVFDIANCIWYAKEGQGLMAAACFIAAIPGAGDLVGLGIKALGKGSKALRTAKAVSTTFRMVGAIGQTGLAAINLGIAIDAVVNEYQSSYNGRVSTLSLVNLGASVLGVAVGIHSSKKSIREFKSMWNGMRSKGGYRKTSGDLNWDAVVSRRGETRKTHVSLHESNDLSKPSHGVFYGDSVSTINKAWENRRNGYMISEGNTDLYVIPYRNAGYAGGYGGQGNNLNHVTIVTQKGTHNIITGFPGNGYKYTMKGIIGGE